MEKKHSFAVLSFVRQFKHSKMGEASAYLRLTIDGKRTEISTKTIVPLANWISGKGRLRGTSEETRRLNQGIITFEHRAREIYISTPCGTIRLLHITDDYLLRVSKKRNRLLL